MKSVPRETNFISGARGAGAGARHCRYWNAEEIVALRVWLEHRESVETIARRLNRSAASVRVKACRLGYLPERKSLLGGAATP